MIVPRSYPIDVFVWVWIGLVLRDASAGFLFRWRNDMLGMYAADRLVIVFENQMMTIVGGKLELQLRRWKVRLCGFRNWIFAC